MLRKPYHKQVNHEITTYLVKKAATNKNSIAIEDLTNIRNRTNQQPRSKKEDYLIVELLIGSECFLLINVC
ncbi:MAG: hypothetical protein F6K23_34745 [Okeania sp. SIO2C9]|uniref:hypothetical protein n=1 Tax=Okeania sp. SIO2C9 TaxID=2607791 RepID=UPI0013C203AB|nr:hypothetical protein [Okeania sp. SIO2C9]NEQ77722.1 hypothetical protein [Okeania sp. SIO2C9]